MESRSMFRFLRSFHMFFIESLTSANLIEISFIFDVLIYTLFININNCTVTVSVCVIVNSILGTDQTTNFGRT